MFKTFAGAIAGIVFGGGAVAATLSGAGATFPAPIYAKWAEMYRSTGNSLNYQAIGSGGGIKQIKAKTVDFGASDKPLKPNELNASGLYQFPTVIGGVVPVVNIPGIHPGQIKMNGKVLAAIFLGQIKKWNDPNIAFFNKGLKLPNLPITVVHRSDGSGTTFLFTSYLSMKYKPWAGKVGASDSVDWPVGLGGKGNDGVAAFVKQTVGSIGYVEYAYAKQNKSSFVLVQNKSGQYPAPNARAFAAAGGGAPWRRHRATTSCCSTSPAAVPGRLAARPSSWSTRTRRTPGKPRTCSSSSTGLTRTATRLRFRSTMYRFRAG